METADRLQQRMQIVAEQASDRLNAPAVGHHIGTATVALPRSTPRFPG
jgi:hypothetical protein